MVKSSKLFIALFAMIFLVGLVSSSGIENLTITPGEINLNSSSLSSLSKEITLTNTGDSNITNISFKFSDLDWNGYKINSSAFTSITNFNITNNTSISKTISITIPANQYAGEYIGNLTISNGTNSNKIPITLNITEKVNISFNDKTISQGTTSFNIDVMNNGNTNKTVSLNIKSDTIKYKVSESTKTIESGKNVSFNVTVDTSSVPSGVSYLKSIMNLTYDGESISIVRDLTYDGNSYCKNGEKGSELIITSVEDRSSNDDWEWNLLDEITLRIHVENKNKDSSKKVTVKIGLFDVESNKFVKISEDDKEISESIRIAKDDESKLDISFKLSSDLSLNKNYRLYVKAYENEDNLCVSWADFEDGAGKSYFQEIDLDSDDIILEDLSYSSEVSCGDSSKVSFRIHNVDLGKDELMRVRVYNNELGVTFVSEQFELDKGDFQDVSFDLVIPQKATPKSYGFSVYVDYDYKESTEKYKYSDSVDYFTIKVSGDNCVDSQRPSVDAELLSDAKEGKELTVSVKIKNNGNATSYVTVTPQSFESWGEIISGDTSSTLVLVAYEEKTVVFKFMPNKDGQKNFNLKVDYDGKSFNKPVSVSIEENNSFLRKISSSFGAAGSWLMYGIILLIILIGIVLLIKFVFWLFRKI